MREFQETVLWKVVYQAFSMILGFDISELVLVIQTTRLHSSEDF